MATCMLVRVHAHYVTTEVISIVNEPAYSRDSALRSGCLVPLTVLSFPHDGVVGAVRDHESEYIDQTKDYITGFRGYLEVRMTTSPFSVTNCRYTTQDGVTELTKAFDNQMLCRPVLKNLFEAIASRDAEKLHAILAALKQAV